jgi:geranylgeranyl diphosphate synthase, type II
VFSNDLGEFMRKIRKFIDNKILFDKSQVHVRAARYVVLNENAGLWRPLLSIATARDYGGDVKDSLPVSCAIELVHDASLILDDEADKSPLRRKKKSCHHRFGRDLANLTAVYLINRAYNIILGSEFDLKLSSQQKVDISCLASYTGLSMVSGQVRDIMQEKVENSSEVMKMYEQKSGALIGLALACGGIIGNAFNKDVETLRKLGISMGVSYQIKDDVLDAFASASETGKPERQDANKKTLLSILGSEEIKNLRDSKDREVEGYLKSLSVNPSNLREIVELLRKKNKKYFGIRE